METMFKYEIDGLQHFVKATLVCYENPVDIWQTSKTAWQVWEAFAQNFFYIQQLLNPACIHDTIPKDPLLLMSQMFQEMFPDRHPTTT